MRRSLARTAGALALLVLAACTGDGGAGGAGEDEDGKALSVGRADAFETVWSRSVRGEPGSPTVTDEVVLIPHGRVIDVRDARTGKSRRTVRANPADSVNPANPADSADPADRIASVGLTGDVIVAGVEQGSSVTLRGFDLRTGEQLWTEPYGTSTIVQAGDEPELSVRGPVVVTERGITVHAHDGRTIGLDPRTGAPVWQHQPECDSSPYADPASARFHSAAATARYSITLCTRGALTDSGSSVGSSADSSGGSSVGSSGGSSKVASGGAKNVLKAFDPRDGDLVWRADVRHSGGRTTFSTTRDLVALRSADPGISKASFALFGESGDRLGHGTVKDPVGEVRAVGRSGDTVYVHDGRQLHALRADGSPLWVQDAPSDLEMGARAVVSDGETRTAREVPRTGASVIIDPSGRGRATLPWPIRGELIGLSGELLIIRGRAENGSRYTALRLTRKDFAEPALGGVAPSDWPDACSLLSDEQLDGLGEGYLRLPVDESRTVFGRRLPHATQCRFATGSGSDRDIFQITLRWVAADSGAAREVAVSDLPWDAGVKRLNRNVHLIPDPSGAGHLMGDTAVVVSGRRVIEIGAPRNGRLVRAIALLMSR